MQATVLSPVVSRCECRIRHPWDDADLGDELRHSCLNTPTQLFEVAPPRRPYRVDTPWRLSKFVFLETGEAIHCRLTFCGLCLNPQPQQRPKPLVKDCDLQVTLSYGIGGSESPRLAHRKDNRASLVRACRLQNVSDHGCH